MPMSGGFWMRIAVGLQMQMPDAYKLLITSRFHVITQLENVDTGLLHPAPDVGCSERAYISGSNSLHASCNTSK